MLTHHTISYCELQANRFDDTKHFFESVFNWVFQDWGPDYSAFTSPTIEIGFVRSDAPASKETNKPVLIFYSSDLEESQAKVESAGAEICQSIFEFPGGRRFHFFEPSGHEFAIWSDRKQDGSKFE